MTPEDEKRKNLEKLAEIIQAMDIDELKVIAEYIPVELCYNRVGQELARNKKFIEAVTETMTILT